MGVLGHQGAGRAHGHAGSAESATGFFEGLFVGSGWTGAEAPEVVVDSTHSDQFVVSPDALTAEDTLREIPDNKRIGLLQPYIMRHRIEAGRADP